MLSHKQVRNKQIEKKKHKFWIGYPFQRCDNDMIDDAM